MNWRIVGYDYEKDGTYVWISVDDTMQGTAFTTYIKFSNDRVISLDDIAQEVRYRFHNAR